jgi:hypothetical protein
MNESKKKTQYLLTDPHKWACHNHKPNRRGWARHTSKLTGTTSPEGEVHLMLSRNVRVTRKDRRGRKSERVVTAHAKDEGRDWSLNPLILTPNLNGC